MTNLYTIDPAQLQALVQASQDTAHHMEQIWPALIVVAVVQVLLLGLLVARWERRP